MEAERFSGKCCSSEDLKRQYAECTYAQDDKPELELELELEPELDTQTNITVQQDSETQRQEDWCFNHRHTTSETDNVRAVGREDVRAVRQASPLPVQKQTMDRQTMDRQTMERQTQSEKDRQDQVKLTQY